MKLKRLVTKRPTLRLIGVLCFCFGVFITWVWQSQPESIPTGFLVRLQPAPEKVQQNRNLSEYEFGGRTSDCLEMTENETYECYSGTRDFILKHWEERKRAYIIIDIVGSHSDREQHVFIEPDNNNEWRIVFTETTYSNTRNFNSNISVRTARTIKTVRANEDSFYYKKGGSYFMFLDREGKIVEDF